MPKKKPTKPKKSAAKRITKKKVNLPVWLQKTANWLNSHKKSRRLLYVLLIFFALLGYIMIVFRPIDHDIKRIGTSFSIKYSEELGNDWRENYTAIVEDLDVNYVRLMSYWDLIEPEKDNYDFADLDWQFEQAQKNGAYVSLAMGLRQPRWPECHFPDWIDQDNRDAWLPEVMDFIEAVTERYKDHPSLISYQLENEALNHWFGGCNVHDRKLIRDRITEEFNLIKGIDDNTPIIMSLSDQHGLPFDGPVPDAYGYSVYRVVYNNQLVEGYFLYPTPIWYHRLRAAIIGTFRQKDIVIHELQLEPWGPEATVNLPIEEQDKSMSTEQMYRNLNFARQIGLDEAYMWGAEWWYWRKTAMNDPGPWEAVQDIISTINEGGEQADFGRFD